MTDIKQKFTPVLKTEHGLFSICRHRVWRSIRRNLNYSAYTGRIQV